MSHSHCDLIMVCFGPQTEKKYESSTDLPTVSYYCDKVSGVDMLNSAKISHAPLPAENIPL